MKEFDLIYGCPPPEFVRLLNEEDNIAFYRRFCDEQPFVIAFLTKYGTSYEEYALWTSLSIQSAHQVWWNYIGHGATVPMVTHEALDRHYVVNQRFIETQVDAARDQGMDKLGDVCEGRPQPGLRLSLMAGVFDKTQSPMISARDRVEAPDLVRDQNHLFALVGTVLDAIDEVAIEGTQDQESSSAVAND
jgi:hypothetical protein